MTTPFEQLKAAAEEYKSDPVKSLFSTIRSGDTVIIRTPQGQQVRGRAVMRGPYGWVLNTGGQYGRTAIADERNTVKVIPGRGGVDFGMRSAKAIPADLPRMLTGIQSLLRQIETSLENVAHHKGRDGYSPQRLMSSSDPEEKALGSAWDAFGTALSYAESPSHSHSADGLQAVINWITFGKPYLQKAHQPQLVNPADRALYAARVLQKRIKYSTGEDTPGVLHVSDTDSKSVKGLPSKSQHREFKFVQPYTRGPNLVIVTQRTTEDFFMPDRNDPGATARFIEQLASSTNSKLSVGARRFVDKYGQTKSATKGPIETFAGRFVSYEGGGPIVRQSNVTSEKAFTPPDAEKALQFVQRLEAMGYEIRNKAEVMRWYNGTVRQRGGGKR